MVEYFKIFRDFLKRGEMDVIGIENINVWGDAFIFVFLFN